jgi:hypothetical protein
MPAVWVVSPFYNSGYPHNAKIVHCRIRWFVAIEIFGDNEL